MYTDSVPGAKVERSAKAEHEAQRYAHYESKRAQV